MIGGLIEAVRAHRHSRPRPRAGARPRLAVAGCVVAALTAGCGLIGTASSVPADYADVLQKTPAARGADDQQRLTDTLNLIYQDSTLAGLRYYAKFVDLNGNGRRDAVALVAGADGCAAGCDLYVLVPHSDRYRAISRIPAAKAPVFALRDRDQGWRDLLVTTLGESGPADLQRMRYAGGGYLPVDGNKPIDAQRLPLIRKRDLDGRGLALQPANDESQPQSP